MSSRTCTGPECDRPVRVLNVGLCHTHWRQHKRGHPLTVITTYRREPALCPGPGTDGPCGRVVDSHGLCPAHAAQQANGDGLRPVRSYTRGNVPNGGVCYGPECDRTATTKGLCETHYKQTRKPGGRLTVIGTTVNRTPPPPRTGPRTPSTKRKAKTQPSNLPGGWFKPSPKPTRPARENSEEMMNVIALTNIPKISPEDEQRARRTAARFAPADQLADVLEMLGLAS